MEGVFLFRVVSRPTWNTIAPLLTQTTPTGACARVTPHTLGDCVRLHDPFPSACLNVSTVEIWYLNMQIAGGCLVGGDEEEAAEEHRSGECRTKPIRGAEVALKRIRTPPGAVRKPCGSLVWTYVVHALAWACVGSIGRDGQQHSRWRQHGSRWQRLCQWLCFSRECSSHGIRRMAWAIGRSSSFSLCFRHPMSNAFDIPGITNSSHTLPSPPILPPSSLSLPYSLAPHSPLPLSAEKGAAEEEESGCCHHSRHRWRLLSEARRQSQGQKA